MLCDLWNQQERYPDMPKVPLCFNIWTQTDHEMLHYRHSHSLKYHHLSWKDMLKHHHPSWKEQGQKFTLEILSEFYSWQLYGNLIHYTTGFSFLHIFSHSQFLSTSFLRNPILDTVSMAFQSYHSPHLSLHQ